MAKKGFDELVPNTYVKICHHKQELQKLTTAPKLNKSLLRRNSSLNNMEMFFKTLNEDDLDYRKSNVCFTKEESLHAF